MHAIDTNVLVRLWTRDDPKQVAAAETFVAVGAWVSHVVLAEATWVLATVYELAPSAIADAIDRALRHQEIVLQDPEVVAAAVALYRKRPRLGFSDCLVLESARKAGHMPLGTFDRDFAKVDGTRRL